MRVKIFTEGGNDIGFGHISRCSSLYYELIKRNVIVDFIVDGEISDVSFLKDINIINDNWRDKNYIKDNLTSEDYAIIDSYKATQDIYEIISQISKKALFIDDIGRITYPKGIILNPSLDANNVNYDGSSNCILLSGPEYIIVRAPFKSIRETNLSNQIRKIMVIMGGTDIRKLTPKIIDLISKKETSYHVDVVIGTNSFDEKEINDIGANFKFHVNVNEFEMSKLMRECDLAITAAGQTMYELISTGTPFIGIQVVDNQQNNIVALTRLNSQQVFLKYDDDEMLKKLNLLIDLFNNILYRRSYLDRYKDLVDGLGAGRIISELIDKK